MAEEVNIGNVGGEGVASEVTLARLTSVMEAMSKKAGVDPKDVTKKLTALSKATDDTVKVSTKNRDALGKNTKAVKESTSAFSKLGGIAGNMLFRSFGAVARSGTEMTKAFLAGETSMTAFASQLPLVGSQLAVLTGIFDNTFTAFQNVAGSGAAFNNSLVELRNSAAGARMPLDEFASMIGANSDKLAAFGGTATEGAKRIVSLNKALGSNRNDLLNMGLGYQEINEALIDYQYLQRAGNRGLKLSQTQQIQQAEAAADYTKNLVTLGKLTGEDVKSQQAKIAQAQMDVAMQAKLATMSTEERKKMDALMASTMASGGQQAVDALKREFLGMPPMTEEAALYTTQFGENINSIAARLEQVYDGNVTAADMAETSTQYMADMIEGNAAAFARLQPGLTAAAAGLDGPMATIAAQLQEAGIQFTDFINPDTNEVDRARLEAAIEQAKAETDARGPATDAMVTFTESLKTLQEAFTTNITTPLMEAVAPAFKEIATALGDGEGFKGVMKTVSDYIKNDLTPGILAFIDVVKKDGIMEAFKGLAAKVGDAIMDIMLGPNTKTIMTPGGPQEVETEREGGLLSSIGDVLVDGMKAGIKYIWEETSIIETMVGGIAALWAGKALASAMLSGVGGLLSAGVARMRSGPVTPGASVGRDPKTGRFTSLNNAPDTGGSRLGRMARFLGRGAKFIPGIGLVAAGAMGAFDAVSGFNADPNAGIGESLGNAGSSVLNGLTFGLLGSSSAEIAAEAANGGNANGSPVTSNLTPPQLATITDPSLLENIDALNSLDTASVRSYTEAMEALVESLSKLNEELSKDNDTMFTSRADAGELLSGISASSSGTSQGTQQLNSTMQQVLVVLNQIRDADVGVERNTRNIAGSNLAQGNVSNLGY